MATTVIVRYKEKRTKTSARNNQTSILPHNALSRTCLYNQIHDAVQMSNNF